MLTYIRGQAPLDGEEYNRLRDDIKKENIHSVITTSVSRVARSIRDFSDFVHVYEENETALYFIRESIKYDPRTNYPYQRAMLQMLGVFAELEAKITQQRTKESIRQMRANGYKW
jgi:DNA invertase Pin-like site-specific DNA recombinase